MQSQELYCRIVWSLKTFFVIRFRVVEIWDKPNFRVLFLSDDYVCNETFCSPHVSGCFEANNANFEFFKMGMHRQILNLADRRGVFKTRKYKQNARKASLDFWNLNNDNEWKAKTSRLNTTYLSESIKKRSLRLQQHREKCWRDAQSIIVEDDEDSNVI